MKRLQLLGLCFTIASIANFACAAEDCREKYKGDPYEICVCGCQNTLDQDIKKGNPLAYEKAKICILQCSKIYASLTGREDDQINAYSYLDLMDNRFIWDEVYHG